MTFPKCTRGWWNVDPEPRVGGGESGRRPKKKVTSQILMEEVVTDAPEGTWESSRCI